VKNGFATGGVGKAALMHLGERGLSDSLHPRLLQMMASNVSIRSIVGHLEAVGVEANTLHFQAAKMLSA
jgi:hypothetical protein